MVSFEAPPSTLTEVSSCEDLVSWRSLVVVWGFFIWVVFGFFFFQFIKMDSQREFRQAFCWTTEWGFVACVQLYPYSLSLMVC